MLHEHHPFYTTKIDSIKGGYETFMPPKDIALMKKVSTLRKDRIFEQSQRNVVGKRGFIKKLPSIYYELISRSNLDGDIVEFGIFEGDTLFFLASLCPERQCIGYDTFKGIVGQDLEYDSFSDACKKDREGDYFCSLKEVSNNLKSLSNVKLIKCDARETDYEIPEKIVFAHLDMDVYHPMYQTAMNIWPKIVYGGTIVFDDFGQQGWNGVWKAVYDFCDHCGIDKRHVRIGTEKQAFLTKL
jgi:hypothetical protein